MIRYTDFPFPERAYVPGKTARPCEEPLAQYDITPKPLSILNVQENPFFLYGVDLYNHHFFWEAHESWECIWKRESDESLKAMIKGLIQVSGGYLKSIQGIETGARKLWQRSLVYLSEETLVHSGIHFHEFWDISRKLNESTTICFENLFIPIKITTSNHHQTCFFKTSQVHETTS